MKLTRRSLSRLPIAALLGGVAPARTPPARAAEGLIKVGSILSVTGPAAFLGEDMKAGLQLAVEQANAAGGINGARIAWTFYDAESQTQKALTQARRLISQDGVDVIVSGGNMSGIALAMAPMAEAARIPFISSEGALAIVTPAGERRWTFKSTVDDGDVLDRIADYMAKKQVTKVALLADTSGFGQGAVEQMKLLAPRRGMDLQYESFGPTDTDMVPQLTRIRDGGAGAIICWTVTPAGVVFLKQAQQLGLGNRVLVHSYGFVSADYMRLAGDAAEPLVLASLKLAVGDQLPETDPLRPGISALYKDFQARFGKPPSLYAAESYDAAQIAFRALRAVGTDRAKLRDAIEGTRDYAGISGVFNFAPDRHSGLTKSDIVIVNWRNGRFNLVDYA